MEIKFIRSNRKTIAIQITRNMEVLVRAPLGTPIKVIEDFVKQKRRWIEKHLTAMQAQQTDTVVKLTASELNTLKQQAEIDIPERVAAFSAIIGVDYKKVSFGFQKTLWGSCSSEGNLRFNALLIFAPTFVRDYIVVHELCHRKHMNHSPAFWAEVKKAMPDYPAAKNWLKTNERSLTSRLP